MIAITFALAAESSDFVNLLEKPALNSREGVETIRGQLHGKSVVVIHTGVGKTICRKRMEILLRREGFEYLISAGFAGALEKELRIGNLVIAENYSSPQLLRSPRLDLPDDGLYLGKLLTVSGMIESNAERESLATKTGAIAVDMETEFIAEACADHELPILSLRAISDTPSEPFPAPAHVLFDLEKQKTNFARLAFYMLTHPGAISRLKVFGERVAIARKALTSTLENILRADLIQDGVSGGKTETGDDSCSRTKAGGKAGRTGPEGIGATEHRRADRRCRHDSRPAGGAGNSGDRTKAHHAAEQQSEFRAKRG